MCAVALGGVGVGGVGRQVAEAARTTPRPGRSPASGPRRPASSGHRPHEARVERLVEESNEVREALARTRVEQARTREQVLNARRRLRVARRQLGKRLWTIYTGGAPSTLGQLLGAISIHQALVTTKYQEEVVGADRAALDRVEQLRRQIEALAAKLADQAERQELLQARLAAQRRQKALGKPYIWGADGPSTYDRGRRCVHVEVEKIVA